MRPEQVAIDLESTRRIDVDEVHRYPIDVRVGQVLRAEIEQSGIDLRLALDDGSATPHDDLEWIDNLNGDRGPENLWWLADRHGRVELVVEPSQEAKPARADFYRLAKLESGEPQPGDIQRVAAQRLALEAQHLGLTDPSAACDLYERALAGWRQAPEPLQIALTLRRIGELWLRSGAPRKALRPLRQAEAEYSDLGELRLRAAVAIQRGDAYRELGRYDEAVATYQQAGRDARQAGDDGNLATAINNRGMIEERRGELERAAEYYEQARELYSDNGSKFEVAAIINLARVEMRLGRLSEAAHVLDRARTLSLRFEYATWRVDREYGWLQHLSGRPRDGIEPLMRAARQLDVSFDSDGSASISNRAAAGVLDRLGSVLAAAGSRAAAQRAFTAALAYLEDREYVADTAHTRSNLCRLLSLDQPDTARQQCLAALGDLRRLGETTGEASVLFELARLERQEGNLRQALGYIEAAVDRLESVRTQLARRDFRGSFLGGREDFDELNLELLMELHTRSPSGGWDGRALEESERSRGRILLEMLAEAEVNLRRKIPPVLAQRLDQIESAIVMEIQRQREVFDRNPSAIEIQRRIDSKLRDLVGEYHIVLADLRRQSPSYAELAHPESIRLGQMRELLDSETLLLSYWLGEKQSFVWALDQERLTSHPLPAKGEIEKWARRWYQHISYPLKAGHLARRRDRAAQRLAEYLLAPIVHRLRARRLVIVADGALRLIPFAALPDLSADDSRFMIESYEMVRLPSMAALASLRRRQIAPAREPAGFLALFSDPVFSASDERLGLPVTDRGGDLPRLKGTSVEARSILDLIGPRPSRHFEGLEARRLEVLKALQSFEVVHLATHAILEPDHPLLSRIALAQVNSRGKADPQELRAFDLYSLDSNAELVVLSACRTVQELRGEGLVGLTRGFMYAGTPRLVASLWKVDDVATALLMERFYGKLLVGKPAPSQALAEAQRSMIAGGYSAYQWAAFSLQGDWRPIPTLSRP